MDGAVVGAVRGDRDGVDHAPGATRDDTVFIRLWAFANLCHILIQWGGRLEPSTAVNLVAAVAVIGYPRSARALVALAAAQIIDTAVLMPNTPDHQYLAALVNLAVVVSYVRSRPRDTSVLVGGVEATARWILLIAYAAAVVAKYNDDFLSASRSCAAFIGHTASFHSLSGSLVDHAFVLGTLVGETTVVTLLAIRRTRAWGVAFGISFHYLFSVSPAISVGDFTTTLWALFVLFLAPSARAALAGADATRPAASSAAGRRHAAAVVLAAVGAVGLAQADLMSAVVTWALITALGPILIATVVTSLLRSSGPTAARLDRPEAAHSVCIVLVIALAASPYVGLGTSSRFTMFSSLRTEGPGTNHLFMPSFHVDQAQNEYLLVERVYGTDTALERALEAHAAMPTLEVRRILADRDVGGIFVTPTGERFEVRAGTDHELRDQPAWWRLKTQHYRMFRVPGTDDEFCSN